MRHRLLAAALALVVMGSAHAQDAAPAPLAAAAAPQADFLFVGSFHMSNPGRDMHNMHADNMLSDKRQREIAEVAKLIERYRPTRIMVEADASTQEALGARFTDSCQGKRPLTTNEVEQLGFRIACDLKLTTVHAVDWNELGPIKDEASVDFMAAVERHHQQAQLDANMASGKAMTERQQALLDHGTVRDVLLYLNSPEFLQVNAQAYFRIGLLGTADDPIGANWVQLWFGRNLQIFNNIVRRTEPGDRVLVIYGAGHGNYLTQLARDSGRYRVQSMADWLSPSAPTP